MQPMKSRLTERWHGGRQRRRTRYVGLLEQLEDRCLLAPLLARGTSWGLGPVIFNDGFVSVRLLSTVTGRIEADPTGAFGDDLFVVSRGFGPTGGGLLPPGPPDVAGIVYRVDPYGTLGAAFGVALPSLNRKVFAVLPAPNGSVSGDAYQRWFDIAFDARGTFSSVAGGPVMFISTVDETAPGLGVNGQNGIYALLPNGQFVANRVPPFNTDLYAFSRRDTTGTPGRLDNVPAAIAVGPGDSFGTDLYVLDGVDDDGFFLGDGNVMYRVPPTLFPPVDLDATSVLHPRVESLLPPTPIPPNDPEIVPLLFPPDIDVRGMVFDPTGGIVVRGQFGEPAFRLYGGLFVASSDVRDGGQGLTRVLWFPTIFSPPVDLIDPRPILFDPNIAAPNFPPMLIGDIAFDHVGFFGGGVFITDYQRLPGELGGRVWRIFIDPATGTPGIELFAENFNVPDPDFVGPTAALRVPFSITFSRDGSTMYVSDADGVWAFYANTLPHTAGGSYIGLTDLRELRVPYDGSGFAAAVIDTGVDGDHLGFQGVVAPGFNPAFPGSGNVDPDGHGTAVAGIIHQIVPEAVIVPVNFLAFGFSTQDVHTALRWIRQNPFVDDPRTPQQERVPIVAANMSFGIRLPDDPDNNVDSDRHAVLVNKSEAIPYKFEFQKFYKAHRFGIVPVGAAGNEGQFFNGMDGSIIPAVLNEVVEVIAAYPYGPVPPGEGPPLTIPDPTGVIALRCTLESGDLIAFPGKITAFSSRNQVSDFAAPGTCVSTFNISLLGLEAPAPPTTLVDPGATAPINPIFNGTSAASPVVAGSFVLGYDVVELWDQVRLRGGVIGPRDPLLNKLHQYLSRWLFAVVSPDVTFRIPRQALPNFAAYLRPDGINSLLQWTAVPREDVNIGENPLTPTGTDDNVQQQRLLFSDRFRSYSHVNVANLVAAVEASVALRFFRLRPDLWSRLASAAGTPGIITATDIERFVADPAMDVTARAMARLLGGNSRLGWINRLRFLDLVADARPDNFLRVGQLKRLIARILPQPSDFPIQDRWRGATKGYAIDPTALRNYHDLLFLSKEHMLWGALPEWAHLSPAAVSGGLATRVVLLPYPTRDPRPLDTSLLSKVTAQSQQTFLPQGRPLAPPGTQNLYLRNGVNNVAQLQADGARLALQLQVDGSLQVAAEASSGLTTVAHVVPPAGTFGAIASLTAVDRLGPDSYDAFGLAVHGHVIAYGFRQGAWTVEDLTEQIGGEPLKGELQAARVIDPAGNHERILLYGLNALHQIVLYEGSVQGWQVIPVSSNAEQTGRRHRELALLHSADGSDHTTEPVLYALREDGHLIEYERQGPTTWRATNLTAITNGPKLAAGLVAQEVFEYGRLTRRIVGLDSQGRPVEYRKRGRLWQAYPLGTDPNSPRLSGEVAIRFDDQTQRTYVIGRDAAGRLVVYVWNGSRWSWSRPEVPAGVQKVAAGQESPSVVVETLDGALAELLFEDTLTGWTLSYQELPATYPQESENAQQPSQGSIGSATYETPTSGFAVQPPYIS
jgi:hypothetical protein